MSYHVQPYGDSLALLTMQSVEKVIIDQESLGRLINELQPNAYASITKVDFNALDLVQVRPVGIYGSKSAIVDFLRNKAIISSEM